MSETVSRSLEELYNFKDRKEILKFLAENPILEETLLEIHTRHRHYFPEGPLYLEVVPNRHDNNSLRLVVSIYPKCTSSDALVKFNQFKIDWWVKTYNSIERKIVIFLEHQDFASSGDPWDALEKLIGSVDGPEDWSIEHDHYIYGTPKRYQRNEE